MITNMLKIMVKTRVLLFGLQTLFCCALTAFNIEKALANSVDTINTFVENSYILSGDNQIVFVKSDGAVSEKYVLNNPPNLQLKYSEIKSLLDSCVWKEYYEDKIMQGHARFLIFFLFDKSGHIQDIFFSKAFLRSDEDFFERLKNIIRKTIDDNHSIFENKSNGQLNDKTFYFLLYRINLYP